MFTNKLLLAGMLVIATTGFGVSDWTKGYAESAGRLLPTPLAAQQALDLHDDPLPAGAVARLGTIRWRHGAGCSFAAFSPDGKTVLSAGYDKTIRVWQFPSGKEIRRIAEPEMDHTIDWIATNGVVHPSRIALTKDGMTVAACFDREVKVYEVDSGKFVATLNTEATKSHEGPALAFSADGSQLACLLYGRQIQIWDWAAGKEIRKFGARPDRTPKVSSPCYAPAFSPDGKTIAASVWETVNGEAEAVVKLWNCQTGNELWSNPIKIGSYRTACSPVFSPDGKHLAYFMGRGVIMLIDATTGQEVRRLVNDNEDSHYLAFSPDGGKLYSYGGYCFISEFDVSTGKLTRKLGQQGKNHSYLGHAGSISGSISVSPDGKTLILSHGYLTGGHSPFFIDLSTGNWLIEPAREAEPVRDARFTPDGKRLTTLHGDHGMVGQWEAGTGKLVKMHSFSNDKDWFWTNDFCSNGKFAANQSPDSGIVIRDLEENKEVVRIPAPKAQGNKNHQGRVVFSSNGRVVAVSWANAAKMEWFELPSGKQLKSFAIIRSATMRGAPTMIFSGAGNLFAAYDGPPTFAWWNVATGKRLGSLTHPKDQAIRSGVFSHDDRCLTLDMADGSVALYELSTGLLRRVYGKPGALQANLIGARGLDVIRESAGADANKQVVLSPDGRTLAQAGFDRAIHLRDLSTGQEIKKLTGHTGSILAIDFAPNGKTISSASADTTVLIWDVANIPRPQRVGKALTTAECWKVLDNPEAAKAYDAICDLQASPKDAVGFLREHLRPAPHLDMIMVEKLIADLDHSQYKVRQQATAELLKLDRRALPVIDKALGAKPTLETQTRLMELREKLGSAGLSGEALRAYRAIEVLEHIGTEPARELLKGLAHGAPGADATIAAIAALDRLK